MNVFSASAPAASMGATPCGAQDIAYFRDRVQAGEVPNGAPRLEGLLSEYDLPLDSDIPCDKLLRLDGEAMPATLTHDSDIRYIAQVGFSANLDPGTFKRAPLHLVAVVDGSDSMSGQPLELVKESLMTVVSQLNPDDELSVVLYSDHSHVYMNPTPVRDKAAIQARIREIQSAGATNMEEGLAAGFDLARTHEFAGTARVMLFTDARPDIGRTDSGSFISMASDASNAGVGMTMIGVGVQFGAELADAISSFRGSNLFFFPDVTEMQKRFEDEFDTMVTELAYDMILRVAPVHGLRIPYFLGLPAQQARWFEGGGVATKIDTIFLSRRKGAIYIPFQCDSGPGQPEVRPPIGGPLASVGLSFQLRGGGADRAQVVLWLVEAKSASLGLVRGHSLIEQWQTMNRALMLSNGRADHEGAHQAVGALASTYRQSSDLDPDLAEERTTLFNLERTLAKLTGREDDPTAKPASPSTA
ncbi:vWA domain-containing protein [Nannocystis pusilla]|uniref:vWA domain-containing protein n=1 Tax=Nannocystis pusilla TaxID=889268 RepID=UPI003BF420AE